MIDFNWQTLVEQNKPDPVSSNGQARLALLPDLLTDLDDWAASYNLATTRLRESVYTGVVTFTPPSSYRPAFLLAKYILWTFNLDVYIDRFDYFRFDRTSPEKWLDFFDRQLEEILSPLYQIGGLTVEQAISYGLRPSLNDNSLAVEEISVTLGKVLLDLYQSLAEWTYQDTAANLAFTLENFTAQIARMIGAMRGELIQNFQNQQNPDSGQLPGMEQYLDQSKFSIGLRPGGAVAVGFAEGSESAWRNCDAAMDTSTKIVRLANDLSSYWPEVEEHKITSVTIALAELGVDPMGHYGTESQEIKEAFRLVQKWIQEELELFARQLEKVPLIPLQNWLQLTLAFALAMYAKGNYIVPGDS